MKRSVTAGTGTNLSHFEAAEQEVGNSEAKKSFQIKSPI
jgi:hypothetical protein